MREIAAILNPHADRGRAARLFDDLKQSLGGRFAVRLFKTERPGAAVELAQQAAEQGAEAVLVIGGDGTVHEAVNGLMSLNPMCRPALGILPAGSGNDVAYALGIGRQIAPLIPWLEIGATRPIDVGEVRALGRSCWMINNVGLLLDGQINLLSHQFSWPRGSGLYLRSMLQTLLRRPPVARLRLECDGAVLQREAILLSIGNGPRSGGKFHLLPTAALDDGRFNYLLAAPMNRLRMLWEVRRLLAGARLNDPRLEWGTFASLVVRSDIALAAHVDGEPWLRPEDDAHELAVSALPGALRVVCPRRAEC